jgi:hypothetical protein
MTEMGAKRQNYLKSNQEISVMRAQSMMVLKAALRVTQTTMTVVRSRSSGMNDLKQFQWNNDAEE